ncbi:hypothetical protein [Alienimonas sp. DA493]|uniref:hypothetical protein n=1 Tax=Alienimonas sp. DA493 TaxID=3373605 RepID=UPI0037547C45
MASLIGGCMLFVYYGFSSITDPDMPPVQQSAETADRFLFNDGPGQIVLIAIFALHAFGGLTSAAVHLTAAITGSPTKQFSIRASIIGGTLLSVIFVSYFLWLRSR